MRTQASLKLITLSCLVSAITDSACAQGTAFTYQGRLNDDGAATRQGLNQKLARQEAQISDLERRVAKLDQLINPVKETRK